ncbi:MAG TPA: hypothetical protein VII90_05260, partial [Anaerolineales bacterium]
WSRIFRSLRERISETSNFAGHTLRMQIDGFVLTCSETFGWRSLLQRSRPNRVKMVYPAVDNPVVKVLLARCIMRDAIEGEFQHR